MAKKEENYIMRERKRWGFLGIPWTFTVYSKDKTNPTLIIKNIRHSNDFYEAISDAIEKDRMRMKMRQSELIGIDDDHDFYEDTE